MLPANGKCSPEIKIEVFEQQIAFSPESCFIIGVEKHQIMNRAIPSAVAIPAV